MIIVIITIIIRPHRRIVYVDAAYWCSSVVCRVCVSVGLSVTIVSPAKTAEPIEMPFGLWTRIGPRNHVLDGIQVCRGKGQFPVDKGRFIVKHRDF